MSFLRTDEGNAIYAESKRTGSNQLMTLKDGRVVYDVSKSLQHIAKFKYWDLVVASFPYDKVADVHDLLISKRFYAKSSEMTPDERTELEEIKEQYAGQHHCMITNLEMGKSILDHHHTHFIKWKGETIRPRGHTN